MDSDAIPPPVTDANAGKRLGGCEIIAKVGQGGMGAVFKARQLSMDRIVAIKILPPKLAADEAFVQRFLREARSAGQLTHPHLINVYDCGQEGSYYYFTMEFIEGLTLKQALERQGPLDEATGVRYAMGVAKALAAAHHRDIVHRDVKPDNILIDPAGEPRLGDLGLAKPMSGELDVTLGGSMMGTPYYIAPEQAKGEVVDGRADLYSLGATMHHLLSGQQVFTGSSASAVAIKHVNEPPPPIRSLRPQISAGMERILLKLLRKDPAQRYQTAENLIDDLQALAQGRLIRAPLPTRGRTARSEGELPPGQANHHPRKRHRASTHKWLFLVIGSVGAGLLALLLVARDSESNKSAAVHSRSLHEQSGAQEPVTDHGRASPQQRQRLDGTSSPQPHPPGDADQAAEMLAFAQQYRTDNPTDFARARTYLNQAAAAGQETVVALQVDLALRTLEDDWNAYARQAWTPVAATAEEETREGAYDEALATLEAFDDALRDRLGDLPQEARTAIDQAAENSIAAQIAHARRALSEDQLDAAAAALDDAIAIRHPQAVAAANAAVNDLREEIDQRGEALATQAAETWGRQEDALIALLLSGDAAAARNQALRLRSDPINRPALPQLQAVHAVADALHEIAKARDHHLDALLNRPITLHTHNGPRSGTLLSYNEHFIRIASEVTLGRETRMVPIPVRWEDLTAEQIATLTANWRPDDAHDHIALACLALTQDNVDRAEAALAQANDHPLHTALVKRTRALRLGEVEAAAEAAWHDLLAVDVSRLNEAQAETYVERLDAYQQTYVSSKYFTTITDDWQARQQSAMGRTATGRLQNQLRMQSAGRHDGNMSLISIGEETLHNARRLQHRGLNVVTLMGREHLWTRHYDTSRLEGHTEQFISDIESLPPGATVLIVSKFDASRSWNNRAEQVLFTLGASEGISAFGFRGSYILIGRVGLGRGNGIERGARSGAGPVSFP